MREEEVSRLRLVFFVRSRVVRLSLGDFAQNNHAVPQEITQSISALRKLLRLAKFEFAPVGPRGHCFAAPTWIAAVPQCSPTPALAVSAGGGPRQAAMMRHAVWRCAHRLRS